MRFFYSRSGESRDRRMVLEAREMLLSRLPPLLQGLVFGNGCRKKKKGKLQPPTRMALT